MRPRPRRRPGPAGPRHQELVGPFTVFAPANEVFGEGGGLLVPKNIKELAAVLTYYVVSGNILRHRGGGSGGGGGGARRAAEGGGGARPTGGTLACSTKVGG
jgi:hypothetical protein